MYNASCCPKKVTALTAQLDKIGFAHDIVTELQKYSKIFQSSNTDEEKA